MTAEVSHAIGVLFLAYWKKKIRMNAVYTSKFCNDFTNLKRFAKKKMIFTEVLLLLPP